MNPFPRSHAYNSASVSGLSRNFCTLSIFFPLFIFIVCSFMFSMKTRYVNLRRVEKLHPNDVQIFLPISMSLLLRYTLACMSFLSSCMIAEDEIAELSFMIPHCCIHPWLRIRKPDTDISLHTKKIHPGTSRKMPKISIFSRFMRFRIQYGRMSAWDTFRLNGFIDFLCNKLCLPLH